MNSHLAWYVARATGYVAWALLTFSVSTGLLFATRLLKGRPKPAWMLDVHRFLSGGAVVFTMLHVVGLMADDYVGFDLVDVLVPFASEWRPAAVAPGVIALYLLFAVEISSLLMKKLPRKVWRGIHLLSHLLFWAATFHLLLAGSDVDNPVSRVVVAVVIVLYVFLTLVRLLADSSQRGGARTVARTAARSGSARSQADLRDC